MKVKRFTVLTVLIAILMYFSNAYCIVYIDIDQDLQDLIDDDVIAFTNQGAGVDYIFGREDAADVNPPANPTEYIVGEGVELQIDWGVQIQMSENVILRIEGKMTDVEDLGAGSIVFERFPGDDAWVSILIWGDNAINDNGIVDLYDCDISGGGSGPADEEGVPCWAGLIVMDGDDGDRPELVLSYCDLERSCQLQAKSEPIL